MKKENKKNKNIMKIIKILTVILLIIFISMVGFIGIYKQNKSQVSNMIKEYTYAMDINGARTIKLSLNEENSDEIKKEENYKISRNIIEKRLKKLGVEEYNIRLNEKNGEMIIEIPEETKTDEVVSNLTTVGKFEIIDSETKEVLLDNNAIKSSNVLYNSTSSGTSVYLEMVFNKEGKNKLEEISKTYVKAEENKKDENATVENVNSEETNSDDSTNESEENSKSTEKKITMKIDDEEIMSTYFDEPITTGKMQLSVGKASTDSKTIQEYASQAQNIAIVLDSGKMPVKYNVEKNQYILSNISKQNLLYAVVAIAVIAFIGIIILVLKYKTNGLLAGSSYIGLAALYLLLIRYTNVIISIESIFAITIILALNYVFIDMLLKNIKENTENAVNKSMLETYKKFFNRIIPICIMVIVFCFIKWIPISSFGMTEFWGLIIIAIYNAIVTRYLLKVNVESK